MPSLCFWRLLGLAFIFLLTTAHHKRLYSIHEVKMNPHTNEKPTFGDLTNLGVEKLEELQTVLTSVLALPVARVTYAQINDRKTNSHSIL